MRVRPLLRWGGYLLLFLLLTVLFTVLRFPGERAALLLNEELRQRGLEEVSVGSVDLALPASIRLAPVTVTSSGPAPEFVLDRVVMRPSLLSLLGGKARWDALLEGGWGELPLTLRLGDEGGWELSSRARGLKVQGLPGASGLPVTPSGDLSLGFSLSGRGDSLAAASGEGDLLTEGMVLSGGILDALAMGEIRVNRAQLSWKIEQGLLTVGESRLEGDLMGTLQGTVRLSPDAPGRSRLDLTLSLRPSLAARERLGGALSLLGADPSSGNDTVLRIRGTLERPAVSL